MKHGPGITLKRKATIRTGTGLDMEAHRRRYGSEEVMCPKCGRWTLVPDGWTGRCLECQPLTGSLL